jgi:uncharacterized protein (UPF0262 family)
MPMGLKNAGSTFQRMMDKVLDGLIGEICYVYLDDIIIFSKGLKEHEERVKQVFDRLKKNGLQPIRRDMTASGEMIGVDLTHAHD